MSAKAVKALTERFSGGPPESEHPTEQRPATDEPRPRLDVTSQQDQEKILNPETVKVKLSYGEIELHQPSVAQRRRIYGFVTRLFVDAAALPGASSGGLFGTRISSLLNENQYYDEKIEAWREPRMRLGEVGLCDKMMLLVAKIMGKPGTVSDEQAGKLAQEIYDKADADDVAILYAQLGLLARVNETANTNPPKRRRKK